MDQRLRLAEDVMGRLQGRGLPPELTNKQCRIVVLLGEDESESAIAFVYIVQGHSRAGKITEYKLQCRGINRGGHGRPTEIQLASTLVDGQPSPLSSTVKVNPVCSCSLGKVASHSILGGARTKRVRLPDWLSA